ncbi:HNH endonuclease [Streptomyces sp. NPDC006235]|uniref:HNH endonuclease n=1 Tax=Streptomyces sp. NPDC006235 TaxID=3156736 RepID=UPI0033BB1DEB
MKTCTKCSEAKPLDAFSKGQARCKPCRAAALRDRYAANTGGARDYHQRYRADNKEQRQTYAADYYKANSGRLRAKQRDYYAVNADEWRKYGSRRRALARGGQHEPYSRAEIFAAYGGTCAYCDAPAEHLDHVVALSRGGADAAHNLLPACAPCNLSKGAKSLAEWAATF